MSADDVLNRRSYRAGDVIFHQGDRGYHAYVVQSGRVRIVRETADGPATINMIEPRGIFGEMALIDRSVRMASAVAEDHCVCVAVPEETVRAKLDQCEPMIRTMLHVMIRLIRLKTDETPLPADTQAALTEEVMMSTDETTDREEPPR